jgi:hypothetical protein
MEAASESSVRALGSAALVLAALIGVALLGATFAGDGSDVDGILPVGGGAVLLLAGVFVAVGLGRLAAPRVGRSGLAAVVSLGLLCAWIGLTIVWSIAPDRSWDAFNRSLAFLAFLGLGIVLAGVAGRLAARVGAALHALVLGAVLTWALVAKAIPALDPEGDRTGRLREPVEYWNALALLADVALVLGLWMGVPRVSAPTDPKRPPGDPPDPLGQRTEGPRTHGTRDRANFVNSFSRVGRGLASLPADRVVAALPVAGGLLVYLATLALLLTLSRMGLVAGVAVVAFWFALSRERVQGGLLLVASAGPAILIAAWAFTRPALVEDAAGRADRVTDGAVFGVLALAGAALVAGLGVLRMRRPPSDKLAKRALLVAAVLAAVAAVAGLGVAVANGTSSVVSCSEVANEPSRFGSLSFSNRRCWWAEAKDVFIQHAPEGAGAATFEIARKRFRTDARNVSQPHSVPLQHLADGGILGLALFLAFVAAAAAACVCALRRLAGAERAAGVALVAAPLAYLLHALVDYSWDFLAVTAPTVFSLGVLAAAGRPVGSLRRRPLLAVATALVAGAVLVSFTSPRLSERSLRESDRALDESDFGDALSSALHARSLNPYSTAPVLALAHIAQRQGFPKDAERRYAQAVELQPENPETWYALGIFEFYVRRNMCAAHRYLQTSWNLDPAGDQWLPGGELDRSRDAVNSGACDPS